MEHANFMYLFRAGALCVTLLHYCVRSNFIRWMEIHKMKFYFEKKKHSSIVQ